MLVGHPLGPAPSFGQARIGKVPPGHITFTLADRCLTGHSFFFTPTDTTIFPPRMSPPAPQAPVFGAREGFTIDSVWRLLYRTVLNPTLATLVALAIGIQSVAASQGAPVDWSLAGLGAYSRKVDWAALHRSMMSQSYARACITALCAGVVIRSNASFNRRARNNGVFARALEVDPSKDVVVVTGGKSAVGSQNLDLNSKLS